MDEFRLWNFVVDEAEIRNNSLRPIAGNEPGLILYFDFEKMNNDTILAVRGAGMNAQYIDIRELRPEMPRFGVHMTMPPQYDNFAWFGRGPHENYCDRNTSAHLDLYQSKVSEQYYPYIRPQENGYKTDIRWLTLTDSEGKGIMIDGLPVFSGSALHNSVEDFDQGIKTNYKHTTDVTPRDSIFVNIDMKQMGVGGDDSWGAWAHPQYQIPASDYEFRFRIFPIDLNTESPFLLHRYDRD